jgi:hypothetical protein
MLPARAFEQWFLKKAYLTRCQIENCIFALLVFRIGTSLNLRDEALVMLSAIS